MQLWYQQQLWQQQQLQQQCWEQHQQQLWKQQQEGSLNQHLQQHGNFNNISCQVESTVAKTGGVVDKIGFNIKLKGLIQEKEEDNNSLETIKTSETTSQPTKNRR